MIQYKIEDLVFEGVDYGSGLNPRKFLVFKTKDGSKVKVQVEVEGDYKHYGRSYVDGYAVSPAEDSFTCTSLEIVEAFDYDNDDDVELIGDINAFCDEFSYSEIES